MVVRAAYFLAAGLAAAVFSGVATAVFSCRLLPPALAHPVSAAIRMTALIAATGNVFMIASPCTLNAALGRTCILFLASSFPNTCLARDRHHGPYRSFSPVWTY